MMGVASLLAQYNGRDKPIAVNYRMAAKALSRVLDSDERGPLNLDVEALIG